jgi:hypothetical protein
MNRVELDAQNGATDFPFWELVAEAYNNKENYRFDDVLYYSKEFVEINPNSFVNHSATKLQTMLERLSKLFNDAQRKYQKSGNHDPDFAAVISGDKFDEVDDVDDFFKLN